MRVMGMISGTSHDGIDVAVVDFTLDGTLLHGSVVHTGCVPYSRELRARLRSALPPAAVSFAEVCALDTLIGQAFGEAARGIDADLICSHGQTVYHWVCGTSVLGTLQIGQPAWIAAATGLPVVSDLRSGDVAAGGQGAPLVALMDTLLLRGIPGRAAALNLGGIANITVSGDPPVAYDTGPANALIDAAVYRITGESYDADGRLALAGTVDEGLLKHLLNEPFYALDPPKSTGKELFNEAYLADLPLDNLVPTLTALTAETVAGQVLRHDVDTLVVSGGGCANPALMAMLRDRMPGVALVPSSQLGAPENFKEAIAFALLGWMTAHGLPGNVPSCTGATRPVILGSVTGRLPLRDALMPSQLRLRG